ncbi:5-oxoprolinase subunit PxpA [Zhouia amylolytica]|uniref:5-oxoprolinase subunit PxpA n=1 Tax=Zhouia amylolytica TaxID=376730 RepID=UPI0020CF87BC|nr:5-oxoprolinase subunit PxpA [Zhouia amylolytica]MCQ0112144.1 5-oxoprolinase subunit PxpA [Zhouia amylolytica]
MIKEIDINCDLGEGLNNEHLIMPYISSCNVACGGHAGDKELMERVVELAMKYQVKLGAHPSYPDKKNFGRVSLKLSKSELEVTIIEQIKIFKEITDNHAVRMHHIKAHGALYNDLAKDEALSIQYLEILNAYKKDVFLYVPYGSVIEKKALESGFKIKYEAFADRNYNEDLSLVPRSEDNAVIKNEAQILNHVFNMALHQRVRTSTGKEMFIKADTFCVHSDTENAAGMLQYLYHNLHLKGVSLAKL